MSRAPLPTAPMWLHRFRGGRPLRDYVRVGAGVEVEHNGPIAIDGVSAHLVAGVRAGDAPAGDEHVPRIGGQALELFGSAAFAVVLVPVDEWVVAAAFGGGRHLLDDLLDIPVRAGGVDGSPAAFLARLEQICRDLAESDGNSPLRWLPEARPLGPDDPLLPELEHRLAAALGGDDRFGPLGACWPSAAAAHVDAAKSFYTNDVGGLGPIRLDPDLDVAAITGRFARLARAMRVSELRDSRLMPCADEHGEQLLTRPIPMDRWVVFETEVGGCAYCLHQGRWYGIGRDAVERVRARVDALVAERSDLRFPVWTRTDRADDEHLYRGQVAAQPGYLRLDRSPGRTPMRPRFRFADLLGPGDELVHVGWLARPTAVGELVDRARVSAWAQRLEPEALRQLDAEVRALDGGRGVAERPRVVVLAAAGRRWGADRLFTVSMVDLLRLEEDLRHHGVALRFADIPFVPRHGAAGRGA